MDWLKERVWQLGLAILLAFVGVTFIYLGTADDAALGPMAMVGLLLFAVALAIPLVSKAMKSIEEQQDEEA